MVQGFCRNTFGYWLVMTNFFNGVLSLVIHKNTKLSFLQATIILCGPHSLVIFLS